MAGVKTNVLCDAGQVFQKGILPKTHAPDAKIIAKPLKIGSLGRTSVAAMLWYERYTQHGPARPAQE